ncbi:hypothetical protein FKW77_008810 [Venturia effusa]|uniref:Methyltransferase n=1 Tax=Venturia effusa TaxID=50376 RepID=A0A517LG48_9PEZI|nr:hypothetical protein FKW77_008810 [Venturia effusa]
MSRLSSCVTSNVEKKSISVMDVQEIAVRKPKNLTTTLKYYDEAADEAKVAEPVDQDKTQPKVWYPKTPSKEIKATIQDITGRENSFTLDKQGFQLSRQPNTIITSSEDLLNNEKIKSQYYPQMQEWLKEVTGAPRVLVYHHGVRTSLEEGVKFIPGCRANSTRPTPAPPVYSVHVDQSGPESHNIVRRHLPKEADALLQKRVVIVNAWRPIKTVYRDPFGIASASSVSASDFIRRPYKFFDETRETLAVRPNPSHEWFYKYQQTPEEVLLFKGFDTHGNARVCPHSAFVDEEEKGKEVRESIEIRALLIYEDWQE